MTLVILAHHVLVRMHQRLHQRGGPPATQSQNTVPPLTLSAPSVCLDVPAAWTRLTPTTLLRLSLAEVRFLPRSVLPLPPFAVAAALALLLYQHRRKATAYRSHRKRRLLQLKALLQPP